MEFEFKMGAGPKYGQIYQHLKDHIVRNVLAPGQYLPSEEEMSREYGASAGTVKKALQMLKRESLIQRTKGHGTRIAAAPGVTRATRTVLILLGDIRRSFFAEIYGRIQAYLAQHDCQPVLQESNDSAETEARLLEKYEGLVQGFIVVPHRGRQNYARYGQLLADGSPLVFLDRYLPEFRIDAVVSDNVQGGYLATRHLLERGHRRIAVMSWPGAISVTHRVDGHKKALAEAGVPFDERLVLMGEQGGYDAAYALTGAIPALHPDVTAIVCPRDDSAWGCIQRLSEMGVSVPNEISVIGYDDNDDICSRIRPRLTTVRQQKRLMGETAARLLVRRLEGGAREPEIVSLPVELVVRESTAWVRARIPGAELAPA